jgi:CRISPR-associated endoribonuclease Cas6
VSEFVHDAFNTAGVSSADIKDSIVFSGIKGQTKVGKGGLFFFSSRVTIVLSGIDEDLLKPALTAIMAKEVIKIGEMELVPEGLERERQPEFAETVKYVSIAPFVPVGFFGQDKAVVKQFLDPTKDEFSDYLFDSTIGRMEDSGRFSDEEINSFTKFQVQADTAYLKKMKVNGKKFSRIYSLIASNEDLEIRGYTMPVTLFAHPKVHEFIFQCGLGEFTSQGYGLMDIANSNALERVEEYKL